MKRWKSGTMIAKRTDSNQSDIVEVLRRMGATVQTLHMVGHGCPDILVGYRGHNLLLECKVGDKRLNEREMEWHKTWKGHTFVVRCPEDAIAALEWIDEE
jgi:hypothetical protein